MRRVLFFILLFLSAAYAAEAPQNVVATALDDNRIALTWSTSLPYYNIKVATDEGYNFIVYDSGLAINTNQYVFSGSPNTIYFFKIVALSSSSDVPDGDDEVFLRKSTYARPPKNLVLSSNWQTQNSCGIIDQGFTNTCSDNEFCLLDPNTMTGQCQDIDNIASRYEYTNTENSFCGLRTDTAKVILCGNNLVCDYRHDTYGKCERPENLNPCRDYGTYSDAYELTPGVSKTVVGCLNDYYFKVNAKSGFKYKWTFADISDAYSLISFKNPNTLSPNSEYCIRSSGGGILPALRTCDITASSEGFYYTQIKKQYNTGRPDFTVSVLETPL